jgi:hypothetical protein
MILSVLPKCGKKTSPLRLQATRMLSTSSPLATFERRQPATVEEVNQFKKDGFILVDNVVSKDLVNQLKERYDKLFKGDFEVRVATA